MEQYRFKGGINLIYTILMFATIFGLLDGCGGVKKTYSPYDNSVVMSGLPNDGIYVLSEVFSDGLMYTITSKHNVSKQFAQHRTTRGVMYDAEVKFLPMIEGSVEFLENIEYINSILPDFAEVYAVEKSSLHQTDVLWCVNDNR